MVACEIRRLDLVTHIVSSHAVVLNLTCPAVLTLLNVQNSGALVHRPLHSHYLWC